MELKDCFDLFHGKDKLVALPPEVQLGQDGSAYYVTPYRLKPCKVRITFTDDKRPSKYQLTRLQMLSSISLPEEVYRDMVLGDWEKQTVESLEFEVKQTIRFADLYVGILASVTEVHIF